MDICMDDALKVDYLNGLLPAKARILFEEHLAACPACRREMAELRRTAAAVAGLTPPSVPGAWTAALKDRLRAMRPSSVAAVPLSRAPTRRRTRILQYAVVTTGVAAGLGLLFWLVMGGTAQPWLSGLSAAGPGISEPGVARTVGLITWILSLHALLFVPSIVDTICRLVRRDGGRSRGGGWAN
jgi:anti-sigma factor RsiW